MVDISIIIPIRNGAKWINNCMTSIAAQSLLQFSLNLEIVVYDDGSNDETQEMLQNWAKYFRKKNIPFVITGCSICKGVGAAKNGAVLKSTGQFLCFQDIDDCMHPDRLLLQLQVAKMNHKAIIGSKISRMPPNSTPRFVNWANNLTPEQLKLQIYTSNGPTILMPTWFCHRSVFEKVGGFDETVSGTPEDLIFFYSHLDAGGDLYRVDQELLIYTYHEGAATFSVTREIIWKIQLERLQKLVLKNWESFTIWNAGKAGRKLVRALTQDNLKKVASFCDVDKKKINTTVELYCPIQRKVIIKLPIIHFAAAKPPFIICMKLELTNGEFEQNLKSMNLKEGSDYVLFS